MDRIQSLEEELQAELIEKKDFLAADWEKKRIQFEKEILEQQKNLRPVYLNTYGPLN